MRQLLIVALGVLACVPARREASHRSVRTNEVWLAGYLAGIKTGYTMYRVEAGRDANRISGLVRMTVGMMGRSQTLSVKTSIVTNSNWTLRSFASSVSSQDGSYLASGHVRAGRLLVEGGPTHVRRSVVLSRPVYPIEALGMAIVSGGYRPGDLIRFTTFDATVMDTMTAEIKLLGSERLEVGGETLVALKVLVTRAKLGVATWLDSSGLPVKEESPVGLSWYRATRETALLGEPDAATLDVLRLFSVPVDTPVIVPSSARRMVLELTGVDTTSYRLAAAYQRVISTSPLRVELAAPTVPQHRVARRRPGLTSELSPSTSIQSDDPTIKAKARDIVAGCEDAVTAARVLLDWVYRSLRKQATASFPNAVDVLRDMRGDCNEHAVLYAALARAAGIPARVVVGLVYLEGAFYYHAWNEVDLDGWMPVDPTFGEFPAGVMRLQLGGGEVSRQAELLGLVTQIGIRIIEVE